MKDIKLVQPLLKTVIQSCFLTIITHMSLLRRSLLRHIYARKTLYFKMLDLIAKKKRQKIAGGNEIEPCVF